MTQKTIGDINSALLEKLKQRREPAPLDRTMEPLSTPMPLTALLSDIAKCEKLVDTSPTLPDKGMAVYRAQGKDIPNVLLELGRLREETFRTVGEGTGRSRDIDLFDEYYDQYFAWDKTKQDITGAYRIGRLDQILQQHGGKGVYTNTLFNLDQLLARDFREGTLEAGRSFVRPEYQRGLTLLLIWSAFGRFIASNPQYKYLMGPVSISNEYQESSKHLMVSYLMKHHPHDKADLVSSKNPPQFDSNLTPEELTAFVESAINIQSLQEFIRHAEGNPKAQIPQLIKLYLELGVRFLAFNMDSDFNSVDGLIWLDIRKIPERIVSRYMGEAGWKSYQAYHAGLAVE
jgi:putative hemolysin